jgi:hypothetical protein
MSVREMARFWDFVSVANRRVGMAGEVKFNQGAFLEEGEESCSRLVV